MGCDIHWYSETKKDGEWFCDQSVTEGNGLEDFPNGDRDYWFFGLLQAVRTEWPWSFPERISFPEDASKEVQDCFFDWGSDAHSEGYLTREELQNKVQEIKHLRMVHLVAPEESTPTLHHHYNRLTEVIENMSSDVPNSDQRIIFWFDN